MEKKVFLKGRGYSAAGTFVDGKLIVHKGSTLGYPASANFKKSKLAYRLREDESIVKNGVVIKDYVFDSPSTAAQFITGGSRDGYITWKVDKGLYLGKYLEDKGIRTQKKKGNEVGLSKDKI